jgi:class 3 adenylate cyclase
MQSFLKRTGAWFTETPEDLPPGEARMHTAAKVGYSVWVVVQGVIALVFLLLDQWVLAAAYAISTVLTVAYLTLFLTGRQGIAFVSANLQNLVVVILTTAYTGLGPGFFLFPLVGLIYATLAEWVDRWVQQVISAFSAIVFVGLLAYGLYEPPIDRLPLPWEVTFAVINGVSVAGFLLMVALTYRATVDRAEAALEAEHAKSEALLHNIMPPAVAERLKDNPEVIADSHKPVTILFADIVGFTDMAGRSTAEELVTLLNNIFSRFDALVDDMELEKIKTIGDAYMVVAGLPASREDHAEAVARLALAMIDATADVAAETGQNLQIRVGLHTGAVVAGVIGQRKFAYDIWGDTVNVSARMESTGAPGRIQVSADTAELLRRDFTLEPRGQIEVKGKGMMETWFLTGEKTLAAQQAD